jgi:hypothetical protein
LVFLFSAKGFILDLYRLNSNIVLYPYFTLFDLFPCQS